MSRSLGDLYAHEVGVSPEPILNTYTLGERDLFLVSTCRGCAALRRAALCCAVLWQGRSSLRRAALPSLPCHPRLPQLSPAAGQPHPTLPPALQLLATDGLWDIMGNEQAADFVERCAPVARQWQQGGAQQAAGQQQG